MKSIWAALAVTAAVAGLAVAAPAALKGIYLDKAHDYDGNYLPDGLTLVDNKPAPHPMRIGHWQLRAIEIVAAGNSVSATFEDVTSPMITSPETGETFLSRTIDVKASAFYVGPARLAFAGTDKTLGAVAFEGTFDKDFFKKPVPDRAHPDDHATLHGTLTFGGKTFKDDYTWFAGD